MSNNATTTTRRIKEIKGGWLDKDSGHLFKNAVSALQSVKRESARNAKTGLGIVVIEWEPTTRIGRDVISAIQER